MWWSHARHVTCRAQFNTWAYVARACVDGSRTLTTAPLMRLCSEMRPPQGFAEQRTTIPGALMGVIGTDALDDVETEAETALAAIIDAITGVNAGSCPGPLRLFKTIVSAPYCGH
mmetsp:Transcript_5538/g.15899  ORF Transcript_5538/g.15899 Transcript_5538/m.15899 type:complete len:115 (-) Transcript_5538:165-509(-)